VKRIIANLNLRGDGRLSERIAPRPPRGPADSDDPVFVAAWYAAEGIDELLCDATTLSSDAVVALAARVAAASSRPVAIAAELAEAADVGRVLAAGAARVVITAPALDDPDYIAALARAFGSERVAVSIQTAPADQLWRVVRGGEGTATEWDAVTWARVVEVQGGGALIVEAPLSDPDLPFDLELLLAVSSVVGIPVFAAGHARGPEDVFDALMIGDADGVVVGGLLHTGRASVAAIKGYLTEHGLEVRREEDLEGRP
jgi:cyclase